jgi:hypothetical protein
MIRCTMNLTRSRSISLISPAATSRSSASSTSRTGSLRPTTMMGLSSVLAVGTQVIPLGRWLRSALFFMLRWRSAIQEAPRCWLGFSAPHPPLAPLPCGSWHHSFGNQDRRATGCWLITLPRKAIARAQRACGQSRQQHLPQRNR